MSDSESCSETESLLRIHQGCVKCCNWRHLCLQSKSAILIIIWTVLIGMAYTTILVNIDVIIIDNYVTVKFDGEVTYAMIVVYFGLAILALLHPLIGFVADVSCGRFKVVLFSASLALISFVIAYLCMYIEAIRVLYDSQARVNPTIIAVGCIATPLIFIGFAGYHANFIQLGLDQQISAPSEDLALFVHWTMWAYNLGSTIILTTYQPVGCFSLGITEKIVLLSIPLVLMVIFIFVLVMNCLKRHWFTSELRQHNPYKIIIKVLAFAWQHKYPLHRSAFTYSGDERPNRLDFAKVKFGGPFTTEQVEDTKSFFKILSVLLALGAVFVVDVPSSLIGLVLFGYHTGNIHYIYVDSNTSHRGIDDCTSWMLVWSGNLKYISGTILFPFYIWFIFSCLHRRIPKMFTRLISGVVMYLLGNLFLLVIDLVGHVTSKHHSTSDGGSMCLFVHVGHDIPHLEMHWAVMIPPSILLGMAQLVVMTTALEFISAQSPQSMKGLIVGMLFAIIGVFQLIGVLGLIPFSVKEIWDTASMRANPPLTNCGFAYLLFTFVVAFVGLVLFLIATKKYTYRVRDDKPYDQSQVEEIVGRYLERTVDSYGY